MNSRSNSSVRITTQKTLDRAHARKVRLSLWLFFLTGQMVEFPRHVRFPERRLICSSKTLTAKSIVATHIYRSL